MSKQFSLDNKSALILEGGGMRGVFTAGVLDNLMDRGIQFPYVIGVSAGACCALSYMAHQRGRAKYGNIDLLEQYNYIGIGNLIFKGNIMDFDLLFHTFPEKIYPYDYEAFARNSARFEIVTTSCLTGKPCYYDERQSPRRIIDIVKASSSMPFVSPIVKVDGEPMLDGGIADSIPLMRAMEQGYKNNMVVLTRNRGYRKPDRPSRVPFFYYRKYPAMRKAIMERNAMYNRQIEQVERLEEEGKVTVLRPVNPIVVDRIERDCNKLLALYNEGYNCANEIQFL